MNKLDLNALLIVLILAIFPPLRSSVRVSEAREDDFCMNAPKIAVCLWFYVASALINCVHCQFLSPPLTLFQPLFSIKEKRGKKGGERIAHCFEAPLVLGFGFYEIFFPFGEVWGSAIWVTFSHTLMNNADWVCGPERGGGTFKECLRLRHLLRPWQRTNNIIDVCLRQDITNVYRWKNSITIQFWVWFTVRVKFEMNRRTFINI